MTSEEREDRRKHLEFIQNVIARQANNSFQIKGWAVAVVGAILAYLSQADQPKYALIALAPTLAFWFLDAYYLLNERRFRRLYKRAVAGEVDCFTIEIRSEEHLRLEYIRCLFSRSVGWLYVGLSLTILMVSCIHLLGG